MDPNMGTPIVMVTGSEEPEVRKLAAWAGVQDFLEKPIDVAQFKRVLSGLLENGGWPYVDRRDGEANSPELGERRVAGAANASIAPRFVRLGLVPEAVHFIERRLLRGSAVLGERRLDGGKTARELVVRQPQRGFRVDPRCRATLARTKRRSPSSPRRQDRLLPALTRSRLRVPQFLRA